MSDQAARIQIVTGRQYGPDEEAYTNIAAYAAGDDTDLLEVTKGSLCDADPCPEDCPNRQPGYDAEGAEDYKHIFYCDFDYTLMDGQELVTHDGKRLRLHIEEVPNNG